jgi:hypothetical protein
MVTQHRDRFCVPHCFDISRALRRNLDMRLVALESLSSYLSIHIKNVQTKLVCDLGDDFRAHCSWNPN